MTKRGIALVTRDRDLRDAVLSSAAAVEAEIDVIESLYGAPACPELVLVGPDLAADVARATGWERATPVLVGFDAAELARWSMTIDARIIVLPEGSRWLGALLAGESPGEHGLVVGVVGGSGGLGTSTFALGLGAAAARRGVTTAVVDGDPHSGGLDLLCGAERAPGWRWPALAQARGRTADLTGKLPTVDGVDVLSMGRLATAPEPEAVDAVLGALRRSHGLVIVDLPRAALPPVEVEATLVVAGRRVADVAAAREAGRRWSPAGVVVRDGAGSVKVDDVGAGVGVPVWGVVPEDPHLARAAEAGTTPGLAGRRRWQRACEQIVGRLLEAA